MRSLDTSKLAAIDRLLLTNDVFKRTYRDDRVAFVHDCIEWPDGQKPAFYQDEILGDIDVNQCMAVRGPRGLGKTAIESWNILHFALTLDGEDWKAPTTASHWRQLTHFLWPEIHKWARKIKWQWVGRDAFNPRTELLSLTLKLATGEAFAIASDTAASTEGAHADNLLYSFDEAKIIPAPIFDSAEGSLSSGNCKAVAMSTPGEPVGRFYDIHARRRGLLHWKPRHVTIEECLRAGRISPDWVERCRQFWGEDSALFKNHCLGDFASSDAEGIIPLTHIEMANERWKALKDSGEWGEFTCIGVDVAREGSDQTVLALRHGNAIRELRRYSKQGTMETTGLVKGVLDAYGGEAMVDVIGVGAGVVDRLREQKVKVQAFTASAGTDRKDKSGELGFVNLRAAAWWNLREMLDPASGIPVALPPDDRLTGDLLAPHWRAMSGGKIQIESKDDIKKRLGRSTDDGDAVVMAFWEEVEPVFPWSVMREELANRKAATVQERNG